MNRYVMVVLLYLVPAGGVCNSAVIDLSQFRQDGNSKSTVSINGIVLIPGRAVQLSINAPGAWLLRFIAVNPRDRRPLQIVQFPSQLLRRSLRNRLAVSLLPTKPLTRPRKIDLLVRAFGFFGEPLSVDDLRVGTHNTLLRKVFLPLTKDEVARCDRAFSVKMVENVTLWNGRPLAIRISSPEKPQRLDFVAYDPRTHQPLNSLHLPSWVRKRQPGGAMNEYITLAPRVHPSNRSHLLIAVKPIGMRLSPRLLNVEPLTTVGVLVRHLLVSPRTSLRMGIVAPGASVLRCTAIDFHSGKPAGTYFDRMIRGLTDPHRVVLNLRFNRRGRRRFDLLIAAFGLFRQPISIKQVWAQPGTPIRVALPISTDQQIRIDRVSQVKILYNVPLRNGSVLAAVVCAPGAAQIDVTPYDTHTGNPIPLKLDVRLVTEFGYTPVVRKAAQFETYKAAYIEIRPVGLGHDRRAALLIVSARTQEGHQCTVESASVTTFDATIRNVLVVRGQPLLLSVLAPGASEINFEAFTPIDEHPNDNVESHLVPVYDPFTPLLRHSEDVEFHSVILHDPLNAPLKVQLRPTEEPEQPHLILLDVQARDSSGRSVSVVSAAANNKSEEVITVPTGSVGGGMCVKLLPDHIAAPPSVLYAIVKPGNFQFRYSLPQEAWVIFAVYDSRGKQIWSSKVWKYHKAGWHCETWMGIRDDSHRPVSSGTYTIYVTWIYGGPSQHFSAESIGEDGPNPVTFKVVD